MSPEAKTFLKRLAAVAIAGWIAGNWLLGPPGPSSAYLDEYGGDHERYIEITKSHEYKVYRQRPHLTDLAENPALEERVNFAAAYETRDAFQSEQRRMDLYALYFEFFNAGLLVVLAIRFGKAPLGRYLSEQIDALRDKMDRARRARETAEARRKEIEEKIARLHEAEMKLASQTETRVERELHEQAEASHYSVGLQEQELVERKRAEVHSAELAVKTRLVDAAIEELVGRIKEDQSDAWHSARIDEFVHDVEAAER